MVFNSLTFVVFFALVLGIHRFMGEAMAATNLVGNGVAAIVIEKWCGQIDEARLASAIGNRQLRGSRWSRQSVSLDSARPDRQSPTA